MIRASSISDVTRSAKSATDAARKKAKELKLRKGKDELQPSQDSIPVRAGSLGSLVKRRGSGAGPADAVEVRPGRHRSNSRTGPERPGAGIQAITRAFGDLQAWMDLSTVGTVPGKGERRSQKGDGLRTALQARGGASIASPSLGAAEEECTFRRAALQPEQATDTDACQEGEGERKEEVEREDTEQRLDAPGTSNGTSPDDVTGEAEADSTAEPVEAAAPQAGALSVEESPDVHESAGDAPALAVGSQDEVPEVRPPVDSEGAEACRPLPDTCDDTHTEAAASCHSEVQDSTAQPDGSAAEVEDTEDANPGSAEPSDSGLGPPPARPKRDSWVLPASPREEGPSNSAAEEARALAARGGFKDYMQLWGSRTNTGFAGKQSDLLKSKRSKGEAEAALQRLVAGGCQDYDEIRNMRKLINELS